LIALALKLMSIAAARMNEAEAPPALRERLRGTNINPETFLATDYLNHFTEVVMLLEMLPSMPECLGDIRAWSPKSYEEHFQGSVFSDRELAIQAYQQADPALRRPFDAVIAELHTLLPEGIDEAARLIDLGELPRLEAMIATLLDQVRTRLDRATAFIHGRSVTMDQASVDATMDMSQDAVDSLFD
jgi:hypothetical protein